MSRTKRRMRGDLRERTAYLCDEESTVIQKEGKIIRSHKVFKKGKALRHGWWSYHHDGCPAGQDKRYDGCYEHYKSWGAIRAFNKNDVSKWKKNPDHPCTFWEDRNIKFFDWD